MKKTLPIVMSLFMAFAANPLSYAGSSASGPVMDIHYRVADRSSMEQPAVHFFSFGCHHCYRFEPLMESWSEKQGIKIRRIPVTYGKKQWEHYAKLYYSLQILTGSDDFTGRLFKEIHEHQNQELGIKDMQNTLDLSEEQLAKLQQLYVSAEVNRAVDEARQLARDYAITGVPAMVLEGRYVSDAAMARGIHGLIGVVDYLSGVGHQEG